MYVGLGGQQRGPNVNQFIEFANFFFEQEAGTVKLKAPLNWLIGGNLRDDQGSTIYGITKKQDDGSILIRIGNDAFRHPKLLYQTIGHELVHAADLTNGNYDRWLSQIGTDYDWLGTQYVMELIMEHHAYMWEASIEDKFGTNYGANSALGITSREIQDLGLSWIFNK